MVFNQLLKAAPDLQDRLTDAIGRDVKIIDKQLLPDKIPATAVAIIWQALSTVLDWRVLMFLGAAAFAFYYVSKRMDSETELLNDQQIFDVSRNLLTQ